MGSKIILQKILILIFIGILFFYLVGVYLSRAKQEIIDIPHNGLAIKNVIFESKSGAKIHGWFLKGKPNMAGILLMHGLRSNRLQMLNRAEVLNKEGYSVLLFDFQGHGESIGEKITFGYLESLDAEAALHYLKKKIGLNKLGVIGVSLGGASALLGKVKNIADAIILESVYPSIEQAMQNRLIVKLGSFGKYLLPILSMQLDLQLGINPKQLQPIEHIFEAKGAVFVIGGEEDKRTTENETISLYEKAKFPKKLWIVKGASHIDFDRYVPQEYTYQILNFFETYLSHTSLPSSVKVLASKVNKRNTP